MSRRDTACRSSRRRVSRGQAPFLRENDKGEQWLRRANFLII
jgi:hypothetical protein